MEISPINWNIGPAVLGTLVRANLPGWWGPKKKHKLNINLSLGVDRGIRFNCPVFPTYQSAHRYPLVDSLA